MNDSVVYFPAFTTYPIVLLFQMHIVLEEQLLVNLPQEAMEDSDTFRNENLYTQACDSVLQVMLLRVAKGEGEGLQGV